MIQGLVLIEAGKNEGNLSGSRIDMLLQALGADLFHHALHRRIDGADRKVMRFKIRLQHGMARCGPGRHHG